MDADYSQQLDFNYSEGTSDPFIYLQEFDEHLEELNVDFVYPFSCKIINFNKIGSLLVIINEQEMINIKFTVSNDYYDEMPMRINKSTIFKNIPAHQIISNEDHTYILDKNGDLYKFRSAQSLDKVRHENILHLRCFHFTEKCCFLMISIVNSKVVLQLYDKLFDKDYSSYQRSVDLILPEDSIQCLENDFNVQKINENFSFASEMLSNITDNDLDVDFFNRFLCIDMVAENIKDIVLVALNDRLYYMKYYGIFDENIMDIEESSNISDFISIENVIISRGKIKAMKYLDSSLIVLDDLWVLTIFYQCVVTNIIKRNEIPLGENITCYKFFNNVLIYSNRHKIVFMKFRIAPAEPEIFEVNLSLIATFSVSQDGKFLLAIDKNTFFYYMPVPQYQNNDDDKDTQEEFIKLTKDDIKRFPEAVDYLEKTEEELKQLSEKIEHESDVLLFLTHIEGSQDTIAGHVKIKYVPFLTPYQEIDIICDPINLQSGHNYIRLVIQLDRLFNAFKFTMAFFRHTANKGVLVRHIEISPRRENLNFAVYVPDEVGDSGDNKLELFTLFYFNNKNDGNCHVLQFPFVIDSIKVSKGYRNHKDIEVEKCINSLNKLLVDDK